MYREIGKTWQRIFKEKAGNISERAIQLRRDPTILRVQRPSRLDRARMLGYKAKQGVAVVRIRLSTGGMRKQRPRSGRRPKHMGVLRIKAAISTQHVAERRVAEKYRNMRVLGSYIVWRDGKHVWYECVLIDPENSSVKSDYNYRRVLGIT